MTPYLTSFFPDMSYFCGLVMVTR